MNQEDKSSKQTKQDSWQRPTRSPRPNPAPPSTPPKSDTPDKKNQ